MGLAALLSGTAAQAQTVITPESGQPPLAVKVLTPGTSDAVSVPGTIVVSPSRGNGSTPRRFMAPNQTLVVQDSPAAGAPGEPEGRALQIATEEGQPPAEAPLGPTPLPNVNILNDLIFGEDAANSKLKFYGWIDGDYTYRSSGHAVNNIAPVMNRFGDEFLARDIGLWITKPLDPKCWSWGFNSIFIAGADASFLTPTAGGWKNTNPRFGGDWTDLNVTAHLPILTEGGVDVKAGRQTTILGPMGALPWQRYFDSSDYAWFNMEEGRYTGVSAIWHINKRLDWYNGIEFGWGTFFDEIGPAPQYITNISYWLDEAAKNTKVWTTVLTGPTGKFSTGNTTVVEVGIQHNWNKYIYQIVDTQIVYSKAPIFTVKTPGYQERAYDVYTYLGAHLTCALDLNTRFEWYDDVDGGGYPGGFGIPHTNYFETTIGFDYHPKKWLQFRPEVRYDHADNPAFGHLENQKNQLSVAADVLLKF
jgi:hypothetical protein